MIISNIEGVKITKISEIKDNRGNILHMLRSDEEHFIQFGECYFSELLPGAIKAWKCHRKQIQNFAVPVGRVLLVIYDNRDFSATNGEFFEVKLGRPDAYYRISINAGIWYGFKSLSNQNSLISNCTNIPHNKSECETIDLDDCLIPYNWVTENVLIR